MDVKSETLKSPPILETALSVSFQGACFSKENLMRIMDDVFPTPLHKNDIIENNVMCVNREDGRPSVSTSRQWVGLRLQVEENLVITLLKPKAGNTVQFACSLLRPYSTWADFTAKSIPLLNKFVSVAQFEQVLRVGVRSINRVVIGGLFPLSDFLRTMPPSPLDTGGALIDNFIYRESFYYPDTKLRAILTRRSEEVAAQKKSFIIDTDVYVRATERELRYPLDNALLDDLHKLRDDLFFGTIGPSAREEARK